MSNASTPLCYSNNHKSTAIFYYASFDELKRFKLTPLPLLSLQMVALSLTPRFLHFFLKPFGQPLFVSQLLVGIFFGPSIIGQNKEIKKILFPEVGDLTLDTFALFSSVIFLFKLGVQMDPKIINNSGKKPYAIGFSCFLMSGVFGFSTIKYFTNALNKWREDDANFTREAPQLAIISSLSSFADITRALSDLNILNSDLGRLATSTAMVANLCHMSIKFLMLLTISVKHNKPSYAAYTFLAVFAFFMFVTMVVRPFALWIARHTPEGEPVKEMYIFLILVMVLVCAFASEVLGLSAVLGTFLLGLLAIPDGPPLGAALVDKLEYIVSLMFMPVHVAIAGMKTDYSEFRLRDEHNRFIVSAEVSVILSCCLGKIIGVTLPSLYFRVPIQDAFLLGLIMNIKGIIDISILRVWLYSKVIGIQTHTVAIFMLLLVTAIVIPLVKHVHDPSTRYLSYERSLVHSKHNHSSEDFRILACVHNEDDVRPVITLLEASNPTRYLPFSIFVLHLIELVGRASPLFISHKPHIKSYSNPTKTERIIKAFQHWRQRHHASVSIENFSTISPYASMHNDICGISLDKKTSLIVFPFHRQGSIDDGKRLSSTRSMKILIKNLLISAPCTLGILIDCTDNSNTVTISSGAPYHVAVLFLGGPDDREALAYAMNMIHHRNVYVTVVQFFAESNVHHGNSINYSERQKLLDDELLDHFRVNTMDNERAQYREAMVKDGVETVWVIRLIKDDFDLMMVGRQRQHTDPNLTAGLSEDWSECEELGIIGDLLASSDFNCKGSILVVQQKHGELSQNQPLILNPIL